MIHITEEPVNLAVLEGQLPSGEIDSPAFVERTVPLGIEPSEAAGVADKLRAIASNQAVGQANLISRYDGGIVGSGAAVSVVAVKERPATERIDADNDTGPDEDLSGMIGAGAAFRQLVRNIRIVAPTDATVLIAGETGTGKELVARSIHDLSRRSKQPYIKVNCAAIPATLLESELFGHEKGSFTGAFAQKIGRFEMAHKGTLFLDEVGEIPLELQSKLLRAIQEQELERVGSTRTIKVDIRIVAATNRDLKEMVEEGKFRSDLYYRLDVFPVSVPPLRERKEDIPMLIRHFTRKHATQMNREIEEIPTATIEALTRYDWPGNIREMQHMIERSVILSTGRVLHVVLPEPSAARPVSVAAASRIPIADERNRILHALLESGGKVAGPDGAAARLGLRRTTLQSRMKKLSILREYK